MARASIYKSEVVRAREKLLAMGRYPSIDAVRIELGNTGSKGTIHRYLKEIEEEEGGSTGTKVAISEALQDLVARLAERLHEEADQRLASLSETHKTETVALNKTIAALSHDIESLRAQLAMQTTGLEAEKTAHADTQSKLQEERIARAQMSQRIQDMEGQLTTAEAHRQSLDEKHRHSREALEHFRSAAKEQREQDLRQFEHQIQFLQGELRTAKESVNAKQQELIRSHEDNARISNELSHLGHELRRLETEIRSLRTAREQLTASRLTNQQLEARLAQTTARVDELSAENQTHIQRLEETVQIGHRRESDLVAARAMVTNYERILQSLSIGQSLAASDGEGQSRVAIENQRSLFDQKEEPDALATTREKG